MFSIPRIDAMASKPRSTKRLKLQHGAMQRVLDVENLLRTLLTLLDLASLASFLEILARDESWREILQHQALWSELLQTHFHGNLPAVEEFNDQEDEEEDDEEIEEIEELDDEEDVIELEAVEMEEILESEEEETQDTQEPQIAEPEGEPIANVTLHWVHGLPTTTVQELACPELKELLRSAEQLKQFEERVQIIQGDIGEIASVGDKRVDGLAFPTASYLRNPHTGAAAVIFRRAGPGLTEHVRKLDVRLDVGQVHATPGFDAGVDKLIHIVGPSRFNPDCLRELQKTYRNVLRCVQEEKLQCVAMTSVSTGNMGMPVDDASWFALCAMQRFMRSTDWSATIAMVCFEPEVYAAFAKNKAKLLAAFNADSVRAVPPLQTR